MENTFAFHSPHIEAFFGFKNFDGKVYSFMVFTICEYNLSSFFLELVTIMINNNVISLN